MEKKLFLRLIVGMLFILLTVTGPSGNIAIRSRLLIAMYFQKKKIYV